MKNLILILSVFILSCGSEVEFTEIEQKIGDSGRIIEKDDQSVTEFFKQEGVYKANKLDIIFIFDNSPSMHRAYSQFRVYFSLFFNQIAQYDWRVMLTSSDYKKDEGAFKTFSDGKNYLDVLNANYENDFFDQVTNYRSCLFCSATIFERPLSALDKAVHHSSNQNTLRKDAEVLVIMMSNEDEGWFGKDASEVANSVQSRFAGQNFKAHSIIVLPKDDACLEEQGQGAAYAREIAEFVDQVGGTNYSICSNSYNHILDDIAQKSMNQEVEGLKTEFNLSYEADIENLKVTVSPADTSLEYDLDINKIIFNKAPKAGTQIEVNYFKKEMIQQEKKDVSEAVSDESGHPLNEAVKKDQDEFFEQIDEDMIEDIESMEEDQSSEDYEIQE